MRVQQVCKVANGNESQVLKMLCKMNENNFKIIHLILRCCHKAKTNGIAWLFERTSSFHTFQAQSSSINFIKISRRRKQKTYYCLMYKMRANACHSNQQLGKMSAMAHGPALRLPLYYPRLYIGVIFLIVGNWSICQFDCFRSVFKLPGEDCMYAASE